MGKSRDFLPQTILVFSIYSACLICSSDALGEACGSNLLGTQLYCGSQYHCCDTVTQSCCADGYVCTGTICISIVAIVLPCVIAIVVIVAIISTIIIVKNSKVRKGKVISPEPPKPPSYADAMKEKATSTSVSDHNGE
ncbi:uncharacterized protein LOC125651182 [Ostrea edulis]|uniref:uncharacterized protein LOC125651182 n=1 Tax=Ostrea edulis TaxID=37623 RepID=UPI0024AF5D48|nr:uncharacterized protein LOC125651182 [Ostrea edulis]